MLPFIFPFQETNMTGKNIKAGNGFTLIEMMIVIAIIGILSAIAVPQYTSYTKRAKFADLIQRTATLKSAIHLCVQDINTLTGCGNGLNGVPEDITTPDKYLASMTSMNGLIEITATAEIDNGILRLEPSFDPLQNQLSWVVAGNCLTKNLCRPQ